jgi:hypothetical protein
MDLLSLTGASGDRYSTYEPFLVVRRLIPVEDMLPRLLQLAALSKVQYSTAPSLVAVEPCPASCKGDI